MTSLHSPAARSDEQDAALADLVRELAARRYAFVTPTPASHARVLERQPGRLAKDVRDVFGWNLPFEPATLEPALLKLLLAADAVVQDATGRLRSRYRVSSLGDLHIAHSSYPTTEQDAVFFGPDSYRFADLIRRELASCPKRDGARLVDIGAGTGVGAIVAAQQCPNLDIVMTDINPAALRVARINARVAGVEAQFTLGADLDGVEGELDIVLANPPYIIDPDGRDYRDGGAMHGGQVAYDMAAAAADRLAPGGRFILYGGSAIVDGGDELQAALITLAHDCGLHLRYRELDPDVFGEELSNPAYADVERIALIGAIMARPG